MHEVDHPVQSGHHLAQPSGQPYRRAGIPRIDELQAPTAALFEPLQHLLDDGQSPRGVDMLEDNKGVDEIEGTLQRGQIRADVLQLQVRHLEALAIQLGFGQHVIRDIRRHGLLTATGDRDGTATDAAPEVIGALGLQGTSQHLTQHLKDPGGVIVAGLEELIQQLRREGPSTKLIHADHSEIGVVLAKLLPLFVGFDRRHRDSLGAGVYARVL